MTRNVGKVLDPPPLARAGCALSSPLRHEHPPPALDLPAPRKRPPTGNWGISVISVARVARRDANYGALFPQVRDLRGGLASLASLASPRNPCTDAKRGGSGPGGHTSTSATRAPRPREHLGSAPSDKEWLTHFLRFNTNGKHNG